MIVNYYCIFDLRTAPQYGKIISSDEISFQRGNICLFCGIELIASFGINQQTRADLNEVCKP